jgi:hypothetical protein
VSTLRNGVVEDNAAVENRFDSVSRIEIIHEMDQTQPHRLNKEHLLQLSSYKMSCDG